MRPAIILVITHATTDGHAVADAGLEIRRGFRRGFRSETVCGRPVVVRTPWNVAFADDHAQVTCPDCRAVLNLPDAE